MLLGRKAVGTVAYMGGIPAVLEPFCWSWGQMVQHNQELFCDGQQYIHYDRAAISDHGPARNSLVSRFLGDWLVQMDTDHSFDPDIVARLVRTADAAGVDVLSAVYQMKNPPHVPVLFQWVGDPNNKNHRGLQPLAKWPKEAKVLQIGSSGGGCLFVRRKVFDQLATAYPRQNPFDKLEPFSEDHSFYLRCLNQKIDCYAAMDIHSNHLRVVPVTEDDLPKDGELMVSDLFPVGGFS
jgi:hypothetical protein